MGDSLNGIVTTSEMKKILSILFFVSLLPGLGFQASAQQIPARPDPPRLVNDFAHAMTPDQVAALESKLVAYDDTTSIQIAIVTVPTTGDYAIEDYALKILRTWQVGNKKTNNGLVILAAIQDRKVYIATGYGMEGSVPDITAKEIVDNEILPNFKGGSQDNYYRGFDQAADAIIKAAAGEYKAPEGYANRGRHSGGGGNIIGLVVIIFIVLLLIGRGRGGGGGGGLFGGGGFLPFMLGSMLGGGFRGGGGGGFGGGGDSGGGGFGGFGGAVAAVAVQAAAGNKIMLK